MTKHRRSLFLSPINPKPLVSDSMPRIRRHSTGSEYESQTHGKTALQAAQSRGHSVTSDKTLQYRIQLHNALSKMELVDENNGKVNLQQFRRNKVNPIWQRKDRGYRSLDLFPTLHTEIIDYVQYTKSVVSQLAVHIEVTIGHVMDCVDTLWPQAKVETFGSYATGLWVPSSDVDLVILGVTSSKSNVAQLKRLATVLKTQKWVESLHFLQSAKVPVIKLVSSGSRVPIDITFESTNTHSGLLARDLVQTFLTDMPEVFPLAIVVKQLLRERGLNDAYTGGLSSYSTVLMLVLFNQLWRAGPKNFHNASIYAAGNDDVSLYSPPDVPTPVTAAVVPPPLPAPVPTKSYAAVAKAPVDVPIEPISYAAAAKKQKEQQKSSTTPSKIPTFKAALVHGKHQDSIRTESVCTASSDISTSEDATDSEGEDGEEACLGELLVRFLEFFGLVFNFKTSGFSVNTGGYIFRIGNEASKPVLVIEDPIYSESNVGASSFAIHNVVSSLEDAFYTLKYFNRSNRFANTPLSCLLDPNGYPVDKKLQRMKKEKAKMKKNNSFKKRK